MPAGAILSGVRATRGMQGITLSHDPVYVDAERKWAVALTIDAGEAFEADDLCVPRVSHWFVVFEPTYPLGSIGVYPAKQGGITETFEHQSINVSGSDSVPWRTGKLCLDSPVRRLGAVAGTPEPLGQREERLRWHVAQAVAWVRAAATNTLMQPGDPFELPWYPTIREMRVVHDESPSSFAAWSRASPGAWGVIVWNAIPGIEKTVVADAYLGRGGALIRASCRYCQARDDSGSRDRIAGLWWLWPSPVVVNRWQVPLSWDELRAAGTAQRINVDRCLRDIASWIRGKGATILLIGYPIPTRHGQQTTEVHWQALLLPPLERVGNPPPGFRENEQWWWKRDRQEAFGGEKTLNYMETANWHPNRMQARGRLDQALCEARTAVVGCGALGSVLAELLVRGGVSDMLLIDHDSLAAGNLVRHTLSGQDIGRNKASALGERLSTTAPFSRIRAYDKPFPTLRADVEALLEDRDVVIDCTATEDVPLALALGWWSVSRLFVSASVGYEARRTFLFGHRGHFFPQKVFAGSLEPLFRGERPQWADRGETLEGAGCWSPVFPARLDDILLAAASCVKTIERMAQESAVDSRLVVFEQTSDECFTGLRRIERPADSAEHSE